jgi:hypothetical protein
MTHAQQWYAIIEEGNMAVLDTPIAPVKVGDSFCLPNGAKCKVTAVFKGSFEYVLCNAGLRNAHVSAYFMTFTYYRKHY